MTTALSFLPRRKTCEFPSLPKFRSRQVATSAVVGWANHCPGRVDCRECNQDQRQSPVLGDIPLLSRLLG